MIREHYTARELAGLNLDVLPGTEQRINIRAKKEGWPSIKREGKGGGRIYPLTMLPAKLQHAILQKVAAETPKLQMAAVQLEETKPNGQQGRQLAKLMIVTSYQNFCRLNGISTHHGAEIFLAQYRVERAMTPHKMPYCVVPELCTRTLHRWCKAATTQPELLGGRYGKRKGTSILSRACGGAVAKYVAALLTDNRDYKGGHLRDFVRMKFGTMLDVNGRCFPLPSLRAFERHIVEWKQENSALFMAVTSPGQYKNTHKVAVGDADAHITGLNQMWQIDASPADAICSDGRYSIYALIDVWSRRAMFSVSKTAKTEASLLLVRKAIMAWGKPETIKTDNGADFVSRRFTMALAGVGILQEISPPYSPEKKPFVERVIGTMQRDLMAILPGFSGHSVAHRQRIREQKDFASRMGESDAAAFSVGMTAQELQVALDSWAAGKYGNAVHSALKMSPNERAAQWPHPVQKPASERALDLLLAPIAAGGGMRRITKSGIRVDGLSYISEALLPYIGKDVLVRHDPADLGRVYAFDENSNYLFEAINPQTIGIDPMQFAAQLKAAQANLISESKKELNRIRRGLNKKELADGLLALHADTKVLSFPQRVEEFSTHAMDEASRAVEILPLQKPARQATVHDQEVAFSDRELWAKRVRAIAASVARGEGISDRDRKWIGRVSDRAWWPEEIDADELTAAPAAEMLLNETPSDATLDVPPM